ncbi:MAG: tetratricopeptide repeat protein [Nitrospirae bacterium]|nr:tetratricopeptide repeat protein [Nitrospirota bacterium]
MKTSVIKNILPLLSVLFLWFSPQDIKADTLEETYAGAIRQLNQEGFEGIDKALKVFEEIIKKDPNFIKAYLSASDAYLLKYEFTEKKDRQWLDTAMNYLNTAIGKDGKLTTAYFKRAIIYFNMEDTDKAVKDLKKSMELTPNYLDARILYLQYLLSIKNNQEAKKFSQSSIELYPKDPAPLKYFGDIFFKEGAYEEAIGLYKKIIPLVPKAPYTYLAMGKSYQNLGKYPEAIESFQKTLSQNPELFEAYFNLAYCYGETGKFKEAINQLETYLKKIPKDISAMNNLALLYEQTGQLQKARLIWLKVKESAEDKNYREKAEQNLYRLLSTGEGSQASPQEQSNLPKQGGKTDEKKSK